MAEYHSLAGKKGKLASMATQDLQHNIFVGFYWLFPKYCLTCGEIIPYVNRRNDYCSHECHGKGMVKTGKHSHKRKEQCLMCGKELSRGAGKCCSLKCDTQYRRIDKYIHGKATKDIAKSLLIDLFGYKCDCCGLTDWMGKPLALDIHHIDGNADNNDLNNVVLLCPNCHTQTDNFKSKNRHSTRKNRK